MRRRYRAAIGLISGAGLGLGAGYNIARSTDYDQSSCASGIAAVSVYETVQLETCAGNSKDNMLSPAGVIVLMSVLGGIIGTTVGVASTYENYNRLWDSIQNKTPE